MKIASLVALFIHLTLAHEPFAEEEQVPKYSDPSSVNYLPEDEYPYPTEEQQGISPETPDFLDEGLSYVEYLRRYFKHFATELIITFVLVSLGATYVIGRYQNDQMASGYLEIAKPVLVENFGKIGNSLTSTNTSNALEFEDSRSHVF
jgi:hypothetical protein